MRNLLIVIDLQKGWWHRETRQAMLNSVELCKKFNGDIIHCCFKNDPNSLFHKQLKWRRFTEPRDTDQIAQAAALNLPIYWRSTYNCVNGETWPVIEQYDRVYIAGVFTDVSVAATSMDLFDRGKPISVVKDCVATLHGPEVQRMALRSLDMIVGSRNMVDSASL